MATHEPALRERLSESRLLDRGRFVFVVAVAVLALALDILGLPLFGVETITEAGQQFVILGLGAYGGLTLIDVAWNGAFGSE